MLQQHADQREDTRLPNPKRQRTHVSRTRRDKVPARALLVKSKWPPRSRTSNSTDQRRTSPETSQVFTAFATAFELPRRTHSPGETSRPTARTCRTVNPAASHRVSKRQERHVRLPAFHCGPFRRETSSRLHQGTCKATVKINMCARGAGTHGDVWSGHTERGEEEGGVVVSLVFSSVKQVFFDILEHLKRMLGSSLIAIFSAFQNLPTHGLSRASEVHQRNPWILHIFNH